MYSKFLLIFILTLFSCNQVSDDFDVFLDQFSEDKNFQNSRIVFPLKFSTYPENEDKIKIKYLEKLSHIDFGDDENAMERDYDKYTVEIKKKNDTIILYKRLGYDNGIDQKFYFNKRGSEWYMVAIDDFSH